MSSQSIVLLIMGVSGSGKSLIGEMLAKKLNFDFIDADHYHSLTSKAKMSAGIPLNDKDRIPWLEMIASAISNCLNEEKSVVVACSALKESYRKILLANANCYQIIYLRGSFVLINERLKLRKHEFMKADLLQSQFEILEEPEQAIYLDVELSPDTLVKQAYQKIMENKQS